MEIRAFSLLGKEVTTTPVPVRVEFLNRGATVEGVLEWEYTAGLRFHLPLQLPSGSRKVVDLSLPLEGWSFQGEREAIEIPSLGWRVRGQGLRPLEISLGMDPALPMVIIGDLKGGFESWRNLPFSTLYTFGKQEVSSPSGWYWQVVYWSPEQIPTQWQMMLGIPVMVLVEGTERLREGQWRALMAWMLAGGHLLISAGSFSHFPQNSPFASLLPPLGPLQRVRLSQPLSSLESFKPPREPVALLKTPGWDDAVDKWVSGNDLLACTRRVGLGRLTLVLGDLSAPAWRGWKGYSAWVRQLIGGVEIPAMALRLEYSFSPLWNLPTHHHLWVLTAYLGLYWFLSWRLWRWLRRYRLLIHAPLALLGLTVLLLLLLLLSLPLPFQKPQYRASRLLLVDRLVPLALEATTWQFGLPSGTYTFRWEQGTHLLTHRFRGGFLSIFQPEGTQEQELQLKFRAISALEPVVRTVRVIELPTSGSQRGDRTLWVNPLPVGLKKVHLRRDLPRYGIEEWEGRVAPLANEVMPGAAVSLQVQSGSPRTPPALKGNEWLVAEVETLPSTLITPIAGKEETLLWLRTR